jgi:F-type H+-transporting ATPase subunit b
VEHLQLAVPAAAPGLHPLAAGVRAAAASGASGSSGSSVFILPNGTFFVELILFLVVFGILAKFILPPIERAMHDRQEHVRAGIAAGDEGRAEAQHLAAERRRVLDEARADARGLLDSASQATDAAVEDARRRGTAEHDRLLAEARPALEAEREQLRRDLLGRLGVLVVDAASQVIGEQVELAPHRGLIEQLVVGSSVAGDGSRGDGTRRGGDGIAGAGSAGGAGREGPR